MILVQEKWGMSVRCALPEFHSPTAGNADKLVVIVLGRVLKR